MSIRQILLFGLILAGCGHEHNYPIAEVTPDAAYYFSALKQVESDLKTRPKNLQVVRKFIYINMKLRWPNDVDKELDVLIEQEGLNLETMNYAVDYYLTTHRFEKLLTRVNEWELLHGKSKETIKWRISALIGLNREKEAKSLLWGALQENKQQPELLRFIAQSYLDLNDTTRAVYAFETLKNVAPNSKILRQSYVPLLLDMKLPEKARALFGEDLFTMNREESFQLAHRFHRANDRLTAHSLLRRYEDREAIDQRIEWYVKFQEWDSALYLVNRVLQLDTSNVLLRKKAEIFAERGWLNNSLELYDQVLATTPTDSIAQRGRQDVARKIAYLRSLRRAEEQKPIFEIQSKKSTENE